MCIKKKKEKKERKEKEKSIKNNKTKYVIALNVGVRCGMTVLSSSSSGGKKYVRMNCLPFVSANFSRCPSLATAESAFWSSSDSDGCADSNAGVANSSPVWKKCLNSHTSSLIGVRP